MMNITVQKLRKSTNCCSSSEEMLYIYNTKMPVYNNYIYTIPFISTDLHGSINMPHISLSHC